MFRDELHRAWLHPPTKNSSVRGTKNSSSHMVCVCWGRRGGAPRGGTRQVVELRGEWGISSKQVKPPQTFGKKNISYMKTGEFKEIFTSLQWAVWS